MGNKLLQWYHTFGVTFRLLKTHKTNSREDDNDHGDGEIASQVTHLGCSKTEEMDPREREKQEEKARERKALLDRAYDRVISSQLSKLASKKTVTGE